MKTFRRMGAAIGITILFTTLVSAASLAAASMEVTSSAAAPMETAAPWHRGTIWVANRGSADVSVISTRTDEVLETLTLPDAEFRPEPMYINFTLIGFRVWVGDRANDRVVVYSAFTRDVLGTVPAGDGVFHQATDWLGLRLWVINDVDDTATVINTITGDVVMTVPMPPDLVKQGAVPHDVKLSPFGHFAYVTFNREGDDVVVQFDARRGRELNRAEVGDAPHCAFSWRNLTLYVPCQNSNNIFVLNAFNLDEREDPIELPGAHGEMVTGNGRRLYVSNFPGGGTDALWVIDTRTNEISAEPTDSPFTAPHNIALDGVGRKLYLTHSGPKADKVTVYRNRPSDGKPIFETDVTVGLNPFGLGFVPF